MTSRWGVKLASPATASGGHSELAEDVLAYKRGFDEGEGWLAITCEDATRPSAGRGHAAYSSRAYLTRRSRNQAGCGRLPPTREATPRLSPTRPAQPDPFLIATRGQQGRKATIPCH